MKHLIVVCLFLISAPAFADGCEFVVGTWQTESFDATLGAQVTSEMLFAEGGGLRIDHRVEDGSGLKYYEDGASWSCENGVITVAYGNNTYGLNSDKKIYLELQEINSSFIAFKIIEDDAAEETDTTVHQAVRISESSYIPCC